MRIRTARVVELKAAQTMTHIGRVTDLAHLAVADRVGAGIDLARNPVGDRRANDAIELPACRRPRRRRHRRHRGRAAGSPHGWSGWRWAHGAARSSALSDPVGHCMRGERAALLDRAEAAAPIRVRGPGSNGAFARWRCRFDEGLLTIDAGNGCNERRIELYLALG
jgi:hypothetical protein